jgi:hypothetical protein
MQTEQASYRKRVREAMKWWRAQNPQFTDAKVRDHGWYGRSVFATQHYEMCCIASISEVLTAHAKATKDPQ